MDKKTNFIKISLTHALIFSVVLSFLSFVSAYTIFKLKAKIVSKETSATETVQTSKNVFAAQKSDKPELKFFVMSFCPYGNQMEDILRPVFDLIGSKVDIKPQYILDKIDSLANYCETRSGDIKQCASYVENKYFKDIDECKKAITANKERCLDEKSYIKSTDGKYYSSLHGRQEANQDIREICAWNLTDDKKIWWNFVDNVNKACTAQNADICWEEQAKKAGFDPNKITECFNKDGIALMDKEIAETEKYKVSGSPTVLVNGVNFPPENAYAQDGKGSLMIGKKVIEQSKFRTPNAIKEAICASSSKNIKECNTVLAELTANTNTTGGGCGQ